ncbi:MAG: PIN domain-containing protein [Acidobacteriaceae bacterium]|nr:PIN domain-containing protein [Acidobacteriaceae bacterium]
MATKPRFYWDACMWIALIKREQTRFEACAHVIEQAQRGEVEIWTSAFTYAEVFKRSCSGLSVGIDPTDDKPFEDYLEQDFVTLIQVDADVGRAARRLLREHVVLAKPQDAIHLASALLQNVHIFHTFDRDNLLGLDGKLHCPDGELLRVLEPPPPPDPDAGTLFEGIGTGDSQKKAS